MIKLIYNNKYMIHFILSFLAVLISAKLVGVGYTGWTAILIFTFILTIINLTVKPIIKLLTWPINFLTLGIFHLILNVLFLMLVSNLTPGFSLTGFWQAAIFGLVLSIIEWILFRFKI